eukprot:5908073-Prymnesium_polylepis.1
MTANVPTKLPRKVTQPKAAKGERDRGGPRKRRCDGVACVRATARSRRRVSRGAESQGLPHGALCTAASTHRALC